MTFELLRKLQRIALYLVIITLPINCLPQRFSITGLGQNLSGYFLILSFLLLAYEYVKYKFVIPRKALLYLGIYVLWKLLCLVVGLVSYEYDELLTLSQIPTLEKFVYRFAEHGYTVTDVIAIKTWLFARFSKDIIILNNSGLFFCFYIWHLYQANFREAFLDIRRAITCMVCFMAAYSVIELSWLKFGFAFAEKALMTINPFLYDIKIAHGWWPPLLWPGQLRSLLREPSFFGILSIMSLPFIWSYLFTERIRLKYVALLFAFSFMIAATDARTAIVVTSAELLLLLACVLCGNRKRYVSLLLIIVMSTGAVVLNAVDWRQHQGSDVVQSITAYAERNVASMAQRNSRSNNARLANLVATLRVAYDYPLMGVGTGLQAAYIDDRLPEFAYQDNEVRNWSRFMHLEGVLKSGYPDLNKYVDVAANDGIPGLILYLLPICYVLYAILQQWRSGRKCEFELKLATISLLGLLAAQLSNAGFINCCYMVLGLLFCKITVINEIHE